MVWRSNSYNNYNTMADNINNNNHEEEKENTRTMSAYHLPREIICDGGSKGCGSDTESSTHASTAEVQLQILKHSESEERCDKEDSKQQHIKQKDEQLYLQRGSSGGGGLKTDDSNQKPSDNTQASASQLVENLSEMRLSSNSTNNNNEEQTHTHHERTPSSTSAIVSPDKTNNTTTTQFEESDPVHIIEVEEKDELSPLYVGRIIGKGGEMIRDLQARSGCRIDVNQNVPSGSPRIITYRGKSVRDIDFAKKLVAMLCNKKDGGEYIDLPLGQATMKQVQVPKSTIGRIIGRGGEMIREVQSKSHARIQIDHSGEYAALDTDHRLVTITGTDDAVSSAEEMILFLTDNPGVDGHLLVRQHHVHDHAGMYGHDHREQLRYALHGPGPYGQHEHPAAGHHHGAATEEIITPQAVATVPTPSLAYWDGQQQQYGVVAGQQGYPLTSGNLYTTQMQTGGRSFGAAYVNPYQQPALHPVIETDTISCVKEDIGHIIGKKGSTINALQRRSATNIQIDQLNYQVSITGPRQGIELAKAMIHEILEHGLHHSYAGGEAEHQEGVDHQDSHDELAQSYEQSVTQVQPLPPPQAAGYPTAAVQYQQYYGVWQPSYPGQQGISQAAVPQAAQALGDPYAAPPSPATSGSIASSLSSPWVVATTADGQIYYYNQVTFETSWEKPVGM